YITMITGDELLRVKYPGILNSYKILIDPVVHLTIGLIVIFPLLMQRQKFSGLIILCGLTTLAAVLIDFDHVVAAGSFALSAMTHIGYRPQTHSLFFALLAGCVTWGVTRRFQYGWLVCVVLISHVIRDASVGGTPYLLWPIELDTVSVSAYHAIELLIYFATNLLVFWEQQVQTSLKIVLAQS
ncbi:MAG: metal-dependent hydrolase, partial [Anaerolineaceae bacterium]|nr:metal-dependent hydrolase [Anaerolineaceae bacterium]